MLKVKNLDAANSKSGFTVIELLVVLSIIGLLAGAIIADYAGQRIPRSLLIAQNELVTNLRLLQSYTLSSRNIGSTSAQYYVAKFDLSNPSQYTLQAISNVSTPPAQVQNVQVVPVPQLISLKRITIDGIPVTHGCALLAFRMPYAKVIMEDGCSLPASPTIGASDDYGKIVSFITNGSNSALTDKQMVITFSDASGTKTKTVSVSGLTGLINFQ